jgi:RNA polymerase sigma-70 factor (ECF subfamily)
MAGADTSLSPGGASFPPTRWSLIAAARGPEEERRAGLEELVREYWRPVYVFIRASWSKSNEDAKDLAQEFLTRLVEGGVVEKADPGKGAFRHYLKGALRHFLMDERKSEGRAKRGGGRRIVSFDAGEGLPEVPSGAEPEELFDRAWGRSLLDRAVEELRKSLAGEGREVCFRVFEAHDFRPGDPEKASYGEVARSLGLAEAEVKAHLAYARLRLRKILRGVVSDTVGSEDELFRELKELFEG